MNLEAILNIDITAVYLKNPRISVVISFRVSWSVPCKFSRRSSRNSNGFIMCLSPFSLIRDFGKQNTRGKISKMRAIDRSDRNPPITATRCDLLTFATSCYGALIGESRSDLSQPRLKEILETFPRVVAHQRKPELKTYSAGFISVEYVGKYTN